ncbi:MAG: DUF2283 domain-containing protein [Proteobacteria bacterium]|nr:DUF2283 domain-containing protein [Pseudomonadota bacterium]
MKIHYDERADHLTITLREKNRYARDEVSANGKIVFTFGPDDVLTEIEICEASKNGEMALSYCNIPIRPEEIAEGIQHGKKRIL